MAYTKVNNQGGGLTCGAKKDGHAPVIEGFLLSLKVIAAKKKGDKPSMLYTLADKKKGKRFEMWGSGYINNNLLEDGKLHPALKGKLIRVSFTGMGQKKGKMNPPRIVLVEVDETAKAPKGVGRIKFNL